MSTEREITNQDIQMLRSIDLGEATRKWMSTDTIGKAIVEQMVVDETQALNRIRANSYESDECKKAHRDLQVLGRIAEYLQGFLAEAEGANEALLKLAVEE